MICSTCQQNKPETDFNKNRWSCKTCLNAYSREYRKVNKERLNKYRREYGRRLYDKIWDYLFTHPCVDCGESDIRCLEFDHVHSNKVMTVAELVNRGSGEQKVWDEIEKCEVRCCNCHRKKTCERSNNYRHRASVQKRK